MRLSLQACVFLVSVGALVATPAGAELQPFEGMPVEELFPEAQLDPAIPTPHGMFGFHPGARPLRHGEVVRYLRALAESSPRATLREYARTHEGRELVYLAVSDEATVSNLDEFQADHARLGDPRGRSATGDAAQIEEAKAVAWIAYGIHGDELSSTDAAVSVAYWLVAGEDELAQKLRRELLILIDPLQNPDGRDRFLAQTASFAPRVPNPDTDDLSHTTVWPWGRGNHYLVDLNRDWISLVQPESRRVEVIGSWNPQLMVDSHEMEAHSTYLFSPPRHPFNPHLPPTNLQWMDRFAADQAGALDRHGYPYFTREWNEEFFPGCGSTWATYLGAVGILYEMSSTEGTLVKSHVGRLRTYAQTVHHQTTSSVANLTTLAENRRAILADFLSDRRRAMERAGRGWPAAWVLPRGRHPERTDHLASLLQRQSIEVLRNEGTPRLSGLIDARTGEAVETGRLPDDVYLVRLDQPAAPLVRQLLDPHIPMETRFLQEEREHLERGKGTRLYETTAWSLPLAYDIEAYWTQTRPGAGWSKAGAAAPPATGKLEPTTNPFGYVIDGASDRAMPFLADLLQRGIHVLVAEKPFRIAGQSYPHGSLLVIGEGNPEDVEQQLGEAAQKHGVIVRAVATAKAQEGPDLGGAHFMPLRDPQVGVWAGWPVSPSAYGALWFLMDQDLGLRFNGLDLGRFRQVDLSRYTVLIFPPSSEEADGYRSVIGKEGLDALRAWIEGGGTAIGIGSGAEFLADAENELTKTRLRRQALEKFPPAVLGLGPETAAEAGLFRAVGIRAPEEPKDDSRSGSERTPVRTTRPALESPYDVAPLLGPGAGLFTSGLAQGTPVDGTPVDLAAWLKPFLPPGQAKPEKEDLEQADKRLRAFSPRGAFVTIELDNGIWLTWGMPEEIPALIRASDTLVAEPPVEVAARFADVQRLHLGGLLWPEAAGRLAHTAYTTRESKGRGQIVLFLNEPEFRGWTLGTRRLLVNAILYGSGLGTRWSHPW